MTLSIYKGYDALTGSPFHHRPCLIGSPDRMKMSLKVLSYMTLAVMPWDSGYNPCHNNKQNNNNNNNTVYLWEKFQWILPLYMKPISFQSKASVVCSVTAAIFIDFCLKKLNVFSQHIGKKTNQYLNSTEQIPRNWNVDQLSMLITS